MLSVLEKRGPRAFTLFIQALLDPDISNADLAHDLLQEERKLLGEAGEFFILWEITVVIKIRYHKPVCIVVLLNAHLEAYRLNMN